MNYQLSDCFSDLEFHDAFIKIKAFANRTLTLSVKYLNIHKDTLPYRSVLDKELDIAKITLQDLVVHAFSRSAYTVEDGNGNLLEGEDEKVYPAEEAEHAFLSELKGGTHISDFYRDGDEYVLDMHGFHLFSARLSFSFFLLEWDDIVGNAWYETAKLRHIILETTSGDVQVEIEMQETKEPIVKYGCALSYKKHRYESRKKEYISRAMASLQKKLPNGVSIKCCLTCVHGNQCPYGNDEYEVFCMKDHVIRDKLDLVDLIAQDHDLFFEKNRLITDICDDFSPQSDEQYTYNDYLYHLKEENNP